MPQRQSEISLRIVQEQAAVTQERTTAAEWVYKYSDYHSVQDLGKPLQVKMIMNHRAQFFKKVSMCAPTGQWCLFECVTLTGLRSHPTTAFFLSK